jgi:hypothetical protein
MADSVADMKKFLSRPDVPVKQVMKLLGRQRPTAAFGGHVLTPHDRRYSQVVIKVDPRDVRKLKQIIFECKEDSPICMADLEPVVGKFRCKYKRKSNETEFRARSGFEEGGIIEFFGTRMEKYRFEPNEEDGFLVYMPDGKTHTLKTSDIFIDYFTFNFIDREPPPDEEVKPPKFP